MLHYSLWARSCPLASGTVITLSSLPRGAVGRAHPSAGPYVHLCLCGEALSFLGLDLTEKGRDTLGKALETIRKSSSACQILVSALEAKLFFFLCLMILVQLRLQQYLQTTGRKRFKNNNRRALTGNNLIRPNSPAVLKTRK